MTLDELKATLDTFSPVKIEFVAKVMESLANPPSASIRSKGTWLTGEPDWIEYFGLALSVHHGATTEPLGLSSFETVFRNACEHLRWSIDPPGSQTQRFVDMVVRPESGNLRRLSLNLDCAKSGRFSECGGDIAEPSFDLYVSFEPQGSPSTCPHQASGAMEEFEAQCTG